MEPKPIEPHVEAALRRLLILAESTLDSTPKTGMTQALAMQTRSGSTHTFLTPLEDYEQMEDRLITLLTANRETAISYLVAMWEDRTVDLPSHSLRKKLIALDPANAEALLLLRGEGYWVARAIGSTM